MNFKSWFLTENTVSQIIKQKYKEKYKKFIKSIGEHVKTWFTANHFHQQLSNDSIEALIKYYSYNYFKYLDGENPSVSTYRSFFYKGGESIVNSHKDYLISQLEENGDFNRILKSKLNDTSFTLTDLDRRVDLWHFSLESRNRTPGAKGETILDLSQPIEPKEISLLGSEWSGWKWVDLEKGYCDAESKSMGHCGNSGSKDGDTILSLRDENNIPHLTFILNDGNLGEMKGRNNNKPSKKYHPAILELLKLPLIQTVRGGGYKPENNFSLDDLDEEILEKLLEHKPDLKFDMFEYMEERMEEIRKDYKVKHWTFVGEHCHLEESEGNPVIYLSGSFATNLKLKLIKPLPKRWTASYGYDPDSKNLLNSIREQTSRLWSIDDLEIENNENGISVSGLINYETYGGNELDNFENFISHLDQEIEPYEQEFKNIIQRVLVEQGYVSPYYVQKATKEQGKVNWSIEKFKNFDWEVTEPDVKTAHEITVQVFKYLKLGIIENKDKNIQALGIPFKENLEKVLLEELLKISKEIHNAESIQLNMFDKQKSPAITEDMKIKPIVWIRMTPNMKSFNSPWDPEKNPVINWTVSLNTNVEITQVDTHKEAKKAERMLHFIDNNYETIKNRLINKFEIFVKFRK